MKDEKNLSNIVEQMKGVDDNINKTIIPLLKDTISDYKKTFAKMIAVIIILIIALIGVVFYSEYMISKEAEKYAEFLKQFEFESEEHIYQETDDNSIINDGISIQR